MDNLVRENRCKQKELLTLFKIAEQYVRSNHPEDIEWSEWILNRGIDNINISEFYLEYVYAVFVSGFRVSVIQKLWPALHPIYNRPIAVYHNPEGTFEKAYKIFGNKRKIKATIDGAKMLVEKGWPKFREEIKQDIDALKQLPYIGDVLKYQMARSVGINCIKPDVHLKRMANHFDMDPFEMCNLISTEVGIPVHTVDTIIWSTSRAGKLKALLP